MTRPPPASPPDRPGKPTPVRALQDPADPSEVAEPVPERRSMELGGVSWEIVADGASVVGGTMGPVHMLLLRFRDDAGGEAREAWIVGRSLGGLPEDRLVEALRASWPRLERRDRPGFFEELGGRTRR